MLMNIGFVEALKIYDYQCFIFHDVDLIPENDNNIYQNILVVICDTHYSVTINQEIVVTAKLSK
jgi:hypothetical protein